MSDPDTSAKPSSADPVGAVWRRWEPHIHTPGTAMNDNYGNSSLSDFLDAVEGSSPKIQSLGITDYCLTRRYAAVLEEVKNGRLPEVGLVFCNIELRYSIETKASKGINIHLLVSPDDPDHVNEANRFLSKLTFRFSDDEFACTEGDLRRLGRAHDPSIQDDEAALKAGVNQFKVGFDQLRDKYRSSAWARANILIAVAGSSSDGTAGLQNKDASFAATRKAIETFSPIIFASTPNNIKFWRGDGVLKADELQKQYAGPKPCLHGSDAHTLEKVGKPDDDRFCWIKGDTTFEALKQACLEPKGRVSIGSEPPESVTPYSVASIATPGVDWLVPEPIKINPGMVAIIGARGSGKTALADLTAHGGDSPFPTQPGQSFLYRARGHLGGSRETLAWSDGSISERSLTSPPEDLPQVHYLTQQFVDRLCSSEAESDELLEEIKRVVFLAHEPEARLGADTFDALASQQSSATRQAVTALEHQLDQLSHDLSTERAWYMRKAGLQRDLDQTIAELKKSEAARQNLIKPGGEKRAAYYTRLGSEITQRQEQLQVMARRLQTYQKLALEVERYSTRVLPGIVSEMQQTFGTSILTTQEWAEFEPRFAGTPASVISGRIKGLQTTGQELANKDGATPSEHSAPEDLGKCGLDELKAEYERVGELTGVDKKNQVRLKQLNDLIKTQQAKRQRLDGDLKRAAESTDRLKRVLQERAALYVRFFELTIEQCNILTELYEPLENHLAEASTSARKLGLRVIRTVDIDGWARAGEDLLDLRKNGKFRGRGALAEVAREQLLTAWQTGTAQEVGEALETFRADNDASLLEQSAVEAGSDEYQNWIIDLGRWLYSTDHINVHYSIEYEGVPITQLSPGTRGIVLLLLYLALDLEDSRPLIIDQPEENLDPKSVFTELLQLFAAARLRRQVVIITHNANLVVNTDVDQVIVASCTKTGGGAPPQFEYMSGGLENPDIRREVCEILEGGATAFKQRARRLRFVISD